ncbi:MAG: hypothetical protein MUE85_15300 [Microscillaceae bacterium]|jgi:hypothetical protein|nr:hypothetical protein [Microscillaceae bacterium]
MKELLYLCLFIAFFNDLWAQNRLYITPIYAIQSEVSRLDRHYGNRYTGFSTYYDWLGGANFGATISYYHSDKWNISTGLVAGLLGWGFEIKSKQLSASHNTGNTIFRIPLTFGKTIQEVNFLRLNPQKDTYLMLFNLELIGGISYDFFINPETYQPYSYQIENFFYPGVLIAYQEVPKVINQQSFSIHGGFALQFRHRGENRLRIAFFYSQGLRNLIDIDVNYNLSGQLYNSRLKTSGSVFGCNISYPIKLITFKKNNINY